MSVVCQDKSEGVSRVIPDEVIHYKILTQLPPKSVLKFKSVCKKWYNVTSSVSFINDHQNYTHNKSPESTDLMIITSSSQDDEGCDYIRCFYTYLDAPRFVSKTADGVIDIYDIGFSRTVDIVGSGNGLVSFKLDEVGKRGYMLVNPVTRDYSVLIPDIIYQNRKIAYRGEIYGFGYDCLSDVYIIVNIKFYNKDEFEEEKCVEVVFYKTSSISWEQYMVTDQSILAYSPHGNHGKVVNNKLHWLVTIPNEIQNRRILTFDLHTEEIGDMTICDELQQKIHNIDLMVSVDGHLFTITTYTHKRFRNTFEIWEMKRYGEAESWMICYKIEIREEFSFNKRIKVITYRSTSEGGYLLLNALGCFFGTNQLLWYNIEKKSFKKVDGDRHMEDSWVCKSTLAPIPFTYLA